MTVTIYHNPRCSKSRETLQVLERQGIVPKIVEYLNSPPTASELKAILKKLRLGPRDIICRREPLYAELGLDESGLDDDALIALMAANPVLIERPIVVSGDNAVIGRSPENVLKIL